jgi:TolB-like protein/Tfp pilus assembly protein PilF
VTVYSRFGARRAAITSIAVLPFEYAGRQPDGEYLSDGITEQLINGLSKVPSLRVVPRSMIFSYKGQPLDPKKVGHELKVGGVVTGRVTQREDGLTITAELIDVEQVSQIWGQQWTRPASRVFDVPEEIAREVSDALQLRLTPDAEQRLARRYTDNPDAFTKYVKSLRGVQRGTRGEFEEAIAAAEQAIVEDMKQRAVQQAPPGSGGAVPGLPPGKDPGFALAYASLARLYTRQAYLGYLPDEDAHSKAKAAADFALQMDGTLSEARGALAFVSFFYEWDWAAADRLFREALRQSPDDDEALKDHAWYLMAMGRTDDALREMAKAGQLNPGSEPHVAALAEMSLWAGHDEEALRQAGRARALDPESAGATLVTACIQSRQGRHAEAIASYLDYLSQADKESPTSPTLAWFYAKAGRREEALDQINDAAPGEISPVQMAWIYAALDDKDTAFTWLEKALAQRASGLLWIRSIPWFDPLRSDPRFQTILSRMKLG